MEHLLEIQIQPATTEELREFDKIAMVDVQPPFFGEKLPRADIAIDHHPGYPGGAAPFEDVRTKYGATATIMTEYLVTADEKISERLATALLYGIRSDTLALSRRVTEDDLQAFAHLYPLANYGLLRQIDRPELPLSFAQILARAMKRLVVKDHLVVLNLGIVERDDIIVQMADFCLQFEGVSWAAVAGKLGSKLVISVRNYGMSGAQRGRSGEEFVRRYRQRRRASQHVEGGDSAARVAQARGHYARRRNRNAPARAVRHRRQTHRG